MKRKVVLISVICFWLDQIIKLLVCKNVSNIEIIPNFLFLIYAENNGVAFSMLAGNKTLIIAVSVMLIIFLIYEFNKEFLSISKCSNLITVAYGILLGGIFGNLFDRLYKGYVVDYVSIKVFNYFLPVFNLSDVLITVGVFILLLITIKKEKNISKSI